VRLADIPHHSEHIVLDLGSSPAVNPKALPDDSRLRLLRVDYSGPWWLSHSTNLAMSQATGTVLVHCDADCLLTAQFFAQLLHDVDTVDFTASRLSLLDWRQKNDCSYPSSGLFWVKRDSYWKVGGFNPYLQGWGGDEVDLMTRLFRAGFRCRRQEGYGVESIPHGDESRVETVSGILFNILKRRTSRAIKRASSRKNMLISSLMLQKETADWPTQNEYKNAYLQSRSLPDIEPIALLDVFRLRAMQRELFQVWVCVACKPTFFGRLLAVLLTLLMPRRVLERFLMKLGIFANQPLLDGSPPQQALQLE
jgi:hypothetical protein